MSTRLRPVLDTVRWVAVRLAPDWRRPGQLVVAVFLLAIAIGTVLLLPPAATRSGESTPFVDALFTATSAVCVTGLIVVDTPTHWSTFGEVVILVLVQVGGFGIMTVASVLGLMVFHRLGLRMQLYAQAETRSLRLGEVRAVVRGVIVVSLVFEAVTTVILTLRFWLGYGERFGEALYLGVFHGVAAFNNAGFALFTDSMTGFATDPWVIVPIAVSTIAGGLGFPVLLELWRRGRTPRVWSLHAKITVGTSAILFVLGALVVIILEWSNPATLGPLSAPGKLLVGAFHGIMPRSGGFNSVDVGEMTPATLLSTIVLMFVGGGSAGTAGGIKVTTFALLLFIVLAEIRGDPGVHVLRRKLPAGAQRQALGVILLGAALVLVATILLLAMTPYRLEQVLFETTSAFGVVGLSTGITGDLPTAGKVLITVLMFVGRLGPVALASALALREHIRRYELPEERPIVG